MKELVRMVRTNRTDMTDATIAGYKVGRPFQHGLYVKIADDENWFFNLPGTV
jgi:hypothetical protein